MNKEYSVVILIVLYVVYWTFFSVTVMPQSLPTLEVTANKLDLKVGETFFSYCMVQNITEYDNLYNNYTPSWFFLGQKFTKGGGLSIIQYRISNFTDILLNQDRYSCTVSLPQSNFLKTANAVLTLQIAGIRIDESGFYICTVTKNGVTRRKSVKIIVRGDDSGNPEPVRSYAPFSKLSATTHITDESTTEGETLINIQPRTTSRGTGIAVAVILSLAIIVTVLVAAAIAYKRRKRVTEPETPIYDEIDEVQPTDTAQQGEHQYEKIEKNLQEADPSHVYDKINADKKKTTDAQEKKNVQHAHIKPTNPKQENAYSNKTESYETAHKMKFRSNFITMSEQTYENQTT